MPVQDGITNPHARHKPSTTGGSTGVSCEAIYQPILNDKQTQLLTLSLPPRLPKKNLTKRPQKILRVPSGDVYKRAYECVGIEWATRSRSRKRTYIATKEKELRTHGGMNAPNTAWFVWAYGRETVLVHCWINMQAGHTSGGRITARPRPETATIKVWQMC